jgi:hypothetical protein
VLCVGLFCGSHLFTGVVAFLYVVLYIAFSYALFSYVQITSFYFLHVNQQNVPVICCV